MSISFEQLVSDIDRAYNRLGHKLGWRFLNVSRDVLRQDPAIALITSNPAGNTIPNDHPTASCESGSSYLVESWHNKAPGASHLQIQVQRLFVKISEHTSSSISGSELIEKSLIGYFIPFRSPRLKDLKNRPESLVFGENLWMNVFMLVRPKLIICIDKDTFSRLSTIIPKAFNCQQIQRQGMNTGWGTIKAEIVDYDSERNIKLLRLPHLSTFKLFSRKQCEEPLNKLLENACSSL